MGPGAEASKKAIACIATRREKKYQGTISREALRQRWQQIAQKEKINHPSPNYQIYLEMHRDNKNRQPELSTKFALTINNSEPAQVPKHLLLRELLRQSKGNSRLEDKINEINNNKSLVKTQDKPQKISGLQQNIELKKIVSLLAAGKILPGYEQLEILGGIQLIPVDSLRINAVVKDYLERDDKKQAQTLILAGNNLHKLEITKQIRQMLISQGKLGNKSIEINILKPKNLNKFDVTHASNYQVGNIIKFRKNSRKFNKNLYYRLDDIDNKTQTITVRDRYGTIENLELFRFKDREVFETFSLSVNEREQMKFTRNQYQHKQRNGQGFRVVGFKDNGQIIIQTLGKTFSVNREQLLYSDFAYADTVTNSKGKTANYLIYAASSSDSIRTGQENFYLAATRARCEFTVYAASAQALGLSISESITRPNTINTQTTMNPPEKPTRNKEFQLSLAAFYLLENRGKSDGKNSSFKIYKAHDGTEIKRNKDYLIITQQGNELKFDLHNNTVKNTFSATEINHQVIARTQVLQQHKQLNQSQNQNWSIEH